MPSTDDALPRWRTWVRPKGSTPWSDGEPLTYRLGPDATDPLEYLNWGSREGSRWSVALSEDGTRFTGTRDDPDATRYEVRGELEPSGGPAVPWTLAVDLTPQSGRASTTAEWTLLLDDGSGAPPGFISWLDRAGNSGSLDLSGPGPDTVRGWYAPVRSEVLNVQGRSAAAAPVADLEDEPAEPGPVTPGQWRAYLDASTRHEPATTSDEQLACRGLQRDQGWLGEEPATETEVAAAEARLGVRLPPSYRNFLLTSNGWSALVGLYGATGLSDPRFGWLRETDPELVQAWADIEDDEIDAVLNRTLLVGQEDTGTCWLLDPTEISAEGEWVAYRWWCGDDGGFDRHSGFGALAVSMAPAPA